MRPIWEGTISFGLINIPVRLYNASKEKRLAFNYLRKEDLCPIKYVRVCRDSGEEVPYEDIVKGYEYQKGDFIVLEDKDFERANVKKTHSIDVFQFADISGIDLKLLEKPYYLEPKKEAQKAYVLLREALKKSKKVGVAKFVLRTKENLAIIRPEGNILVLDKIRYEEEIIKPEDLDIPAAEKIEKRELDIAVKLIDQLTDVFKPENYKDTYTEELKRVIVEKSQGKIPESRGEEPEPTTEMEEIMEKLKKSLEYARQKK